MKTGLLSALLRDQVLSALLLMAGVTGTSIAAGENLFQIRIMDQSCGWPVPLVELRTTHEMRFVSDNAGIIAIDAPELMGRECWFSIEGHGYGVEPDGFNYRGTRLTPTPGGMVEIQLRRDLPARRLGRITGAGIFGESQRFGLHTDWTESGVFGCDSVQIAMHRGALFWAWGDTTLPHYPLGIFHTSSATTTVNPLPRAEPPVKLAFNYFRDGGGRIRPVAIMQGDGPTWLSGYVSIPDENNTPRLVANYVKVRNFLEVYESGLCVWDEDRSSFRHHKTLWSKSPANASPPPVPDGHPIFWKDENGSEWLLFGDPFPRIRMKPVFESWENPESWSTLSPQKAVSTMEGHEDREVVPHRGSVVWSPFRRKWVSIFTQMNGKPSHLGEIWYAESDSPFGTWQNAVQVVTHNKYTFYNPRIHPHLSDLSTPVLLFEATYTRQFSGNSEPSARHDYNQVLYRLDLDDPVLYKSLKNGDQSGDDLNP